MVECSFVKIPNDTNTASVINQMRVVAKRIGCKVRVRGRCGDRKGVFKLTGRKYCKYSPNDIYFGSREAQYCHSWGVYLDKKK